MYPAVQMFAADWALILYLLYVPLLILLYVLQLIVIYRERLTIFRSSFFRIFSALAVVVSKNLFISLVIFDTLLHITHFFLQNILACMTATIVYRLPKYPIMVGFFDTFRKDNEWLKVANLFV